MENEPEEQQKPAPFINVLHNHSAEEAAQRRRAIWEPLIYKDSQEYIDQRENQPVIRHLKGGCKVTETNGTLHFCPKSANSLDVIKKGIEHAKEKWGGRITKIEGTEEFKAACWAYAQLNGVKIDGYEPTPRALALLDKASRKEAKSGRAAPPLEAVTETVPEATTPVAAQKTTSGGIARRPLDPKELMANRDPYELPPGMRQEAGAAFEPQNPPSPSGGDLHAHAPGAIQLSPAATSFITTGKLPSMLSPTIAPVRPGMPLPVAPPVEQVQAVTARYDADHPIWERWNHLIETMEFHHPDNPKLVRALESAHFLPAENGSVIKCRTENQRNSLRDKYLPKMQEIWENACLGSGTLSIAQDVVQPRPAQAPKPFPNAILTPRRNLGRYDALKAETPRVHSNTAGRFTAQDVEAMRDKIALTAFAP